MSAALSRDALLDRLSARPVQEVEVPGVGPVLMREMSVRERQDWSAANSQDSDGIAITIALVMATLCGEGGERCFTSDDAEAFGDSSGPLLEALAKEASRINGIGADAQAAAEKNSATIPSGESSSE